MAEFKDIKGEEREKVADYFYNLFEERGYTVYFKKVGFEPKIGDVKFVNGHYLAEVVAEVDDNHIVLEKLMVDKGLKECHTSLSPTYLFEMYKTKVEDYYEAKDVLYGTLQDVRDSMLSGELKLDTVKSYLDWIANSVLIHPDANPASTLPKDVAMDYWIDTEVLCLDIMSEIGLLYVGKLEGKYEMLANYCTMILHDLNESNLVHRQIEFLHCNEELFQGIARENKLAPGKPPACITTDYDLSIYIDNGLWERLEWLNDEINKKRHELTSALQDYA